MSKRYQMPTRDGRGGLHYSPNDVDPLCDFCSEPTETPVAALLTETGSITIAAQKMVSTGEWYVCAICLAFVIAHDGESLAARAARLFLKRHNLQHDLELRVRIPREMKRLHAIALDQLKEWPSSV